MASTNKTQHYNLPQWESNDKPTFLGDFNTSFATIDTMLYNNNVTGDSALNLANDLNTTSIKHNAEISALQTAVSDLESRVALHTTHFNEIDNHLTEIDSTLNSFNAVLLYNDLEDKTADQMNTGVKFPLTLSKNYDTYLITDTGGSILIPTHFVNNYPYTTLVSYSGTRIDYVSQETTTILTCNLGFGSPSMLILRKITLSKSTGTFTIEGLAVNGIKVFGINLLRFDIHQSTPIS